MITKSFWPLDYDPEGAIYENPSWDLPGFRRSHQTVERSKSPATGKRGKKQNS